MVPEFDPDKLYLTKAQLSRIGDRLVAGWQRTGREGNTKLILMTRALQLIMKPISEENIQQYYKDFFREAFAVMQENALEMPELKVLKQVQQAKDPELVSELDFSMKRLLLNRLPHWPGTGDNDS